MLKEVWANPWVRFAAASAAVLGLVMLAIALRPVLLPLLCAFLVAYIFNPVVNALGRRKIPRGRAVVLVVAVLLCTAIVVPLVLIPSIVMESGRMVREAQAGRALAAQEREDDAQNAVEQWIDAALDRLPLARMVVALGWAEEPGATSSETREVAAADTEGTEEGDVASVGEGGEPGDGAASLDNADAREIMREQIALWIHANAEQYLRAHASLLANAGKWAGASLADLFRALANAVVGMLLFIGNFVLFAIVTVYLLRDYELILQGVTDLIPPRNREKALEIFAQIDVQLRAFLRGQFVVCCCLGGMYAVGFLVSGVPFGLTLAIFGGLASFLPFIGIVLTTIPVVLLTLVEHGLGWEIAGVAVTFGVAQFLESNFLTPRIVGSQVGLGPVWVILSVMVFSTLFGFVGLLVAVPIAAVLKVLVLEGLQWYRSSHVFQDSS